MAREPQKGLPRTPGRIRNGNCYTKKVAGNGWMAQAPANQTKNYPKKNRVFYGSGKSLQPVALKNAKVLVVRTAEHAAYT